MSWVQLSGQRMHYTEQGEGEAVVFLHGLLMDSTLFEPQIRFLRDRYRCIALDARGHGRSDPPEGAFTQWDAARDLIGLLDQMDIPAAHVVGMSQGGYAALRAALGHPGRIKTLTLMSSQAGLENDEQRARYHALLEHWLARGLDETVEPSLVRLLIGERPTETLPRWLETWRAVPPEVLLLTFAAVANRDDVTARLPEIRCPTLVVWGDRDPAVTQASVTDLCAGIRDCRLMRVGGGGHAVNLTHEEQVNPALLEFLDTHAT